MPRSRLTLMAIGGGEDKEGACEILREFIRLSGGAQARIVVMTAATRNPQLGEEYRALFRKLGAADVNIVRVNTREEASAEEALKKIRRATGAFFTGGNQLYVTSLIGGSEMDQVLHERLHQGMVIAGTSAGAAMMSNSMIIGGPPEETPRLGTVQLGPGMEFMLSGIIDTHFAERGRYGRMIAAAAQYPHDIGIGIDRDTAIIVRGDVFEVIGSGVVTIIDAGALDYTNVPHIDKGDALALYGLIVHILPAGHRFDLRQRKPIFGERSPSESASTIARPQVNGKAKAPAAKSKR